MSYQKCLWIVQYLRESKSVTFYRQKHVLPKMCKDSPVLEGISICHFFSAKTCPVKNVHEQSSIWGNLNPSLMVGKNTSCQKCAQSASIWGNLNPSLLVGKNMSRQKYGRIVQYLIQSQSVTFGRQKHASPKMWMDSPVLEAISIRHFLSAKTRPAKNVDG